MVVVVMMIKIMKMVCVCVFYEREITWIGGI